MSVMMVESGVAVGEDEDDWMQAEERWDAVGMEASVDVDGRMVDLKGTQHHIANIAHPAAVPRVSCKAMTLTRYQTELTG
jgi:hypothetical protein